MTMSVVTYAESKMRTKTPSWATLYVAMSVSLLANRDSRDLRAKSLI
jgi:hypothetical protein